MGHVAVGGGEGCDAAHSRGQCLLGTIIIENSNPGNCVFCTVYSIGFRTTLPWTIGEERPESDSGRVRLCGYPVRLSCGAGRGLGFFGEPGVGATVAGSGRRWGWLV